MHEIGQFRAVRQAGRCHPLSLAQKNEHWKRQSEISTRAHDRRLLSQSRPQAASNKSATVRPAEMLVG